MSAKKPTRTARQLRRRRLFRNFVLMVVGVGLVFAWVWQRTLPLQEVAVIDAVHADAFEVIRLTGAKPDSVAVYSLSPAMISDRAQRHPWVRRAFVRRLPTGTLRIRLEERVPVAMVMRDGEPGYFLDEEGYAMPLDAAAPTNYNVPVLSGRLPEYHPTQRVVSAPLREMLRALGEADAPTNALISEVNWQPRRVTLWTTPVGGHTSVPVRLARSGFSEQFERLRAFWDQSVLPRPSTPFRHVDLRFMGQVVTQEGDEPPKTTSNAASDSTTAR